MHQSSYRRMGEFCREFLDADPGLVPANRKGVVVDLGSQDINGSYKPLFDPVKWDYVGIDMADGKNVDIVLRDPYRWSEVADASVDCLISGQAFEHTEFFWLTMQEIARVLRPGGYCCILAPSSGPEHRYPQDCWRFYADGMTALARWAKLDCLRATTAWAADWPHDDDQARLWQDSMLVARKPASSSSPQAIEP